jgi:hypothetical protein
MSSSISPTFACFPRGSLLGSWWIGRSSPGSMRFHSVCPSTAIILQSKDVSLPCKEVFEPSGLIVTEVWPGCCNDVVELRGSVLDLWLFRIRWDHQCDWLTVCQGDLFLSFWSQRLDGDGFPRYCLQRVALFRLPFGPSSGVASSGDSLVPSLSKVTRHGLSRTHPCVSRLGSALSIMTARDWGP